MRPVNERPQWPTGIRPTPASIAAWGEALIRQLVTVFQEFGYRLNHVLPKDGSEAMEGDLDMGGFAIVNTPSLGNGIVDAATLNGQPGSYYSGLVDAHAALTDPHSAVSVATADRLILRDGAGRAQVADPSVAADIATKGYVDSVAGPLPGMLAQRTGSDQSIVQYAFTKVVFNTKVYDDGGAFDTVTSTYTVPATGIYAVSAFVRLSAAAGEAISARVMKNGSSYLRVGEQFSGATGLAQVGGTFTSKFTSGDTLTVEAYTSAAAPTVNSNELLTYFAVQRLF